GRSESIFARRGSTPACQDDNLSKQDIVRAETVVLGRDAFTCLPRSIDHSKTPGISRLMEEWRVDHAAKTSQAERVFQLLHRERMVDPEPLQENEGGSRDPRSDRLFLAPRLRKNHRRHLCLRRMAGLDMTCRESINITAQGIYNV